MSLFKDANIQAKIVEAFGIGDLPEDKQAQVLARAGELLIKRLFLKVADILSPEDRDNFDQMLGQEPSVSEDQVSSFLTEKIPNIESLLQDEISSFAGEFKV